MLLVFLMSNPLLIGKYIEQYVFSDFFKFLLKFNIVQGIISLIFFTLFYKLITPVKVRLADAILGAFSFVFLFIAGKTFYWIYLHYAKMELVEKFGNFYTLIVAVLWIYYLVSSFFIGASISHAYVDLRKIKDKDEVSLSEIPV
jgi:membrane protein